MRKSGNKWGTEKCGRCGKEHHGYSGKLDQNGIEYVVCGETNKCMNISGEGKEGNSFAFTSVWIKEPNE